MCFFFFSLLFLSVFFSWKWIDALRLVFLYRLACLPPKDCLHIKALVISQAGLFITQGGHNDVTVRFSTQILFFVFKSHSRNRKLFFFLKKKVLIANWIRLITFDLVFYIFFCDIWWFFFMIMELKTLFMILTVSDFFMFL